MSHGQVTGVRKALQRLGFVSSLLRGHDGFPFPTKGGTVTHKLVGQARGSSGRGDPGFLHSHLWTQRVGVGWTDRPPAPLRRPQGHVAPQRFRVPQGQEEGRGGQGRAWDQVQPGPLTFPSACASSSSCHFHRTWRRTMGTRVYLYFPSRGQVSPGKHVGPEPWLGGGWVSHLGLLGRGAESAQRAAEPRGG